MKYRYVTSEGTLCVKSLADESEADDVFCGKELGGGYLKQFW